MIKIKRCSNPLCKEPDKLETNEFYYEYKAYNKKKGNHLKLASECKECRRNRSLRDRHIDIEKTREKDREQYYKRRDSELPRMRQDYQDRKEERKITTKRWLESNPHKHREYRLNHHKHEIDEDEWFSCLEYFDWSCAYCGLTIEVHIFNVGQTLHRDHVHHDGSDNIDNCVPACRRCNSSKHDRTFNEWYSKENSIYSKRRYNRIVKWVVSDWKKSL